MPGEFMQMTVSGAAQLERKLLSLPDKVAKKVVRMAMRASAKTISADAKSRARSEIGGKMGALIARQITVRKSKTQRKGAYGINAILRPHPDFVHINKYDGVRHFIPAALEFGHAGPYAGGRWKTAEGTWRAAEKLVRPHPFFRPAWHSKKQVAKHTAETELWRGIAKAAKEQA